MKHLRQRLVDAAFAAAGLVYFLVVLGVRGTDGGGLDFTDRARRAAQWWKDADAPSTQLLASPHPLADLMAVPLVEAFPDQAVTVLAFASAGLVALCIPAVWQMAREAYGRVAGVAAVAFFLGMPTIAGAATITGAGALVLVGWCWLLRLAALERRRWYTTVSLWVLGAAMTLVWFPSIIWLALWVCLEAADSDKNHRPATEPSAGMFQPADLPAGVAIAPAVAVVAAAAGLLAVGLELKTGLAPYFREIFLGDPPALVFGGEQFDGGPPLAAPLVRLVLETPPAILAAATVGLAAPLGQHFGWFGHRRGGPAHGLIVATLALVLLLPWILGRFTLGAADVVLIAAPLVALAGGRGLSVALRASLDWLEASDLSMTGRRGLVAGTLALVLLPPVLETARVHPWEESYYTPLTGGLPWAAKQGYPIRRSDVLPLSVARRVADRTGDGRLYSPEFRRVLTTYTEAGELPPIDFAKSMAGADIQLREVRTAPFRTDGNSNKRRVFPLVPGSAASMAWEVDGFPVIVLESTGNGRDRSRLK